MVGGRYDGLARELGSSSDVPASGFAVGMEVVDTIVRGIKCKGHGAAIAAAVDRCAEILAGHFPLKPDDRNELGNSIIFGKGR